MPVVPGNGAGKGDGMAFSMQDLHINKESVLWAVGITVAIVAQFLSNLGSILQKRSHIDEQDRPLAEQRHYTKRGLWWWGLSFVLIGSVADFVALTLAPQSIVATLGCLTLVAQVVWAPLILGERLGPRHYVATCMIIGGVVLAVVYGPHTEGHFALAQLLARFQTLGFGLYVLGVFSVVLSLYGLILFTESRFKDLPAKPRLSDYVSRPTATLTNAASNERRRAWDARLARFHRISYGLLSGVIGAQVVLLGKFIGELIAILVGGGDTSIFTTPATYLILIALAGAVVGQISTMNAGVARFQSLYVLPVFQASWTLTSVIGGLVVFDEWAAMNASVKRQLLFPFGIVLTLFAVYYLMFTPALPEDSRRRSACIDRLLGGGKKGGPAGGATSAAGAAGGSPLPNKGRAGSSSANNEVMGKGATTSSGNGNSADGGISSSDVSTPAKPQSYPPPFASSGLRDDDDDDDDGNDNDDESRLMAGKQQGRRGVGNLDPVPPTTAGKRNQRAGSNNLLLPPEAELEAGNKKVDWNRTCNEIWSLHLPEADHEEEKELQKKQMKASAAAAAAATGSKGRQQQLNHRGSTTNVGSGGATTTRVPIPGSGSGGAGRGGGGQAGEDEIIGVMGGVGGFSLTDTAFYLDNGSSSSRSHHLAHPLQQQPQASPRSTAGALGGAGSTSPGSGDGSNANSVWSSAVAGPPPGINQQTGGR